MLIDQVGEGPRLDAWARITGNWRHGRVYCIPEVPAATRCLDLQVAKEHFPRVIVAQVGTCSAKTKV